MSAAEVARPLVTFNKVTLAHGRHPAVRDLNGTIAAGSLTAIVGPNGAGKSTLLKGVAGLLRPVQGRIAREGLGRADTAYLPQQSDIDRTFPASVFDLVALGLWRRRGMFGRITPEDRRAIGSALAETSLEDSARRSLDTLSGGQFQRALFARVMLQDAKLILLDEPFTAIDADTVGDLMTIIRRWRDEGRAVMVALHDLDLVRDNFPDALLLANRPIAWGPTGDVLSRGNLAGAWRLRGDEAGETPIGLGQAA